jgi:hypothetical protein
MQGAFNVDWDKVLEPGLDEETQRLYRTEGVREARAPAPRPAPAAADASQVLEVPRTREAEPPRSRGRLRKAARKALRRFGRKHPKKRAPGPGGLRPRAGDDDEPEDDPDQDDEDEDEDDDDEDEDDDDDDPAAAEPARPMPARRIEPIPPAPRFKLERPVGRLDLFQFFVIPGHHRARLGKFGHYLLPCIRSVHGEGVPFPSKKPELDVQIPCISAGMPGFPWPSPGWAYQPTDEMDRAAAAFPVPHVPKFLRTEYRASCDDPKWRAWGPAGDQDPSPYPPNPDLCEADTHFVSCPRENDQYCEVGRHFLEERVEEGERLDYVFALKMQGLLGGALESVWGCLDPSFNPMDRKDALHQFMHLFTTSFYGSVSFEGDDDPREVATEALQEHRAFCQARTHFSGGLTRAIDVHFF